MQRFSNSIAQIDNTIGTKDRVKLSNIHKKLTSKKLTVSNVVCIDFLKYLFFIVYYLFSLRLYCIIVYCICQHLSYIYLPLSPKAGTQRPLPLVLYYLCCMLYLSLLLCLLLSLSIYLSLDCQLLHVGTHGHLCLCKPLI